MLRMVDPGTTLVKEIKKHPAAFGTHPIQFVKDFKYLKREQDARYVYLISFYTYGDGYWFILFRWV